MIKQSPPELFAERPVRSDFGQSSPMRRGARPFLIVGALLIVIAGGFGLYLKYGEQDNTPPGEIPTIKAEMPLKQRPEQPGGIDIPHQDVQVFQQIDNNEASKQPSVEHLLPPPEVPQAAPTPLTEAAPSVATPPSVAALPAEPLTVPPTTITAKSVMPPVPATPVATAPTPSAAPASAVEAAKPAPQEIKPAVDAPSALTLPTTPKVATTVQPPAKAVATPAKEATTKPEVAGHLPKEMFMEQPTKEQSVKEPATKEQTGKSYFVQLASFPDQEVAQTELKKLQTKYASALGSVRLRIVRADLGSKGTYYRVQSESLAEKKAKSICTTLLGQKASCIIVHP